MNTTNARRPWQIEAASWLMLQAANAACANARWPNHAAAYEEWQKRPIRLRWLADMVMRAKTPRAASPQLTLLPQQEELRQIIYALQRQGRVLEAQAEALFAQLDYSAEFPAEDAERLREAIVLIESLASLMPAGLGAEA